MPSPTSPASSSSPSPLNEQTYRQTTHSVHPKTIEVTSTATSTYVPTKEHIKVLFDSEPSSTTSILVEQSLSPRTDSSSTALPLTLQPSFEPTAKEETTPSTSVQRPTSHEYSTSETTISTTYEITTQENLQVTSFQFSTGLPSPAVTTAKTTGETSASHNESVTDEETSFSSESTVTMPLTYQTSQQVLSSPSPVFFNHGEGTHSVATATTGESQTSASLDQFATVERVSSHTWQSATTLPYTHQTPQQVPSSLHPIYVTYEGSSSELQTSSPHASVEATTEESSSLSNTVQGVNESELTRHPPLSTTQSIYNYQTSESEVVSGETYTTLAHTTGSEPLAAAQQQSPPKQTAYYFQSTTATDQQTASTGTSFYSVNNYPSPQPQYSLQPQQTYTENISTSQHPTANLPGTLPTEPRDSSQYSSSEPVIPSSKEIPSTPLPEYTLHDEPMGSSRQQLFTYEELTTATPIKTPSNAEEQQTERATAHLADVTASSVPQHISQASHFEPPSTAWHDYYSQQTIEPRYNISTHETPSTSTYSTIAPASLSPVQLPTAVAQISQISQTQNFPGHFQQHYVIQLNFPCQLDPPCKFNADNTPIGGQVDRIQNSPAVPVIQSQNQPPQHNDYAPANPNVYYNSNQNHGQPNTIPISSYLQDYSPENPALIPNSGRNDGVFLTPNTRQIGPPPVQSYQNARIPQNVDRNSVIDSLKTITQVSDV